MRKLASIQRIDALEPIEGRDRIELASVQGRLRSFAIAATGLSKTHSSILSAHATSA